MKKELYLIGIICEEEISPTYIRSEIEGLTAADSLVCYIHTDGGYVNEGFAIFNILDKCPANKTIIIIGTCASMGTVICMAFNKVLICRMAEYMTHEVKSGAMGTSEDLRSAANKVDILNNLLLDTYSKKTGKTREELKKDYFKKTDTYLSPQQAVDEKFVDGFYENESLQIKGFATMDNKAKNMAIKNLFKDISNNGSHAAFSETEITTENNNSAVIAENSTINSQKQNSKDMNEKMFAIVLANLVATKVFTENDRKAFEALAKHDQEAAESFLTEKQEAFAKSQTVSKVVEKEVLPNTQTTAEQEAWNEKVAAAAVAKSLHEAIKISNAQNASSEQVMSGLDKSKWDYETWLKNDEKGFAKLLTDEPAKAEQITKAHFAKVKSEIFDKKPWHAK